MVNWAKEEEQVEFNQGIATLMRIHSCLLELGDATTKSDYFKQYRFLRTLYKELKPLMNEKERAKFKTLRQETDKSYKLLIDAVNKHNKKIDRSIVEKFDVLEEELRDIIQSKGAGLPKKMDPKFALGSK